MSQMSINNSHPINHSLTNKHSFPNKHDITDKYSPTEPQASELNLFRTQIDVTPLPQTHPYTAIKGRVNFYRFIFMTIGILYVTLGMILMLKSFNWTYHFLFGAHQGMKVFLCTFCGSIAIGSIIIGASLKPEREALKNLFNKSKQKIKLIYSRKASQYGITRHISPCPSYSSLKEKYHTELEKLENIYEDTLHLVYRIRTQKSLDETTKEKLLNQAVLEFKAEAETTTEKLLMLL